MNRKKIDTFAMINEAYLKQGTFFHCVVNKKQTVKVAYYDKNFRYANGQVFNRIVEFQNSGAEWFEAPRKLMFPVMEHSIDSQGRVVANPNTLEKALGDMLQNTLEEKLADTKWRYRISVEEVFEEDEEN